MVKEDFVISNQAGLSLTVTTRTDAEVMGIMGGDNSNPSWEEYMSFVMEEYKPHFELLKKAIQELGWVGKTGEDISNYYAFVFSDGKGFSFSWRAWGDLMQAIVNKKEGYMRYYM
jgi:hypothetical protein